MDPVKKQLIKQAFYKRALGEEAPEGHITRRMFLGNPISTAIESRPGEKMQGFGDAYGHALSEELQGAGKGALVGGGAGGTLGAILGALPAQGYHGPRGPGSALSRMGRGSLAGGLLGGLGGGIIGDIAGSFKGHYGQEASRIHGARSKTRPKDGDGDGKINDGKPNEDATKEGAFYELGARTAANRLGL